MLLTTCIYAFGKKDVDEQVVENPSSWQETFDIIEKEEGKFNLIVTASDSSGNESVAGPFNVFIDPDSDLPITGIANPVHESVVLGNINIVGTSIDDDAVSYVELIIDGNIEVPVRADGTGFWSYFLDTSDLSEGVHTIEAYGVDINGVKGNSSFVSWSLNRQRPVTAVNNFALGQLLSGKITLEGSVTDGNGIKSLMYSLDRGVTFTPIKIKHNTDDESWRFSLPIDTTEVADGPAVCLFQAEDSAGASSVYTWLFFADNTDPDVGILYPEQGGIVNGKFSVSGFAADAVGVETLTWSLSKDLFGDFELIPGNPYWVADFDLRDFTGKKANLSISATDTVGNTTVVKRSFVIDAETDKPILDVQFPPPDYEGDGSLYLRGIAQDDDGIAQVLYSLNEQAEIAIETEGVFYADLPLGENSNLVLGKNTLAVRALDIHGVYSDVVSIPFTIKSSVPVFSNPIIIPDKRVDPLLYVYGMTIQTTPKTVFEYTATGSDVKQVTWQLGNGVPQVITLRSPKDVIELEVPLADAPLGLLPLYVTAIDSLGREAKETLVFYLEKTPTEAPGPKTAEDGTLIEVEPEIVKPPLSKTVSWLPESHVQEVAGDFYVMLPEENFKAYADFSMPISAEITSMGEITANMTQLDVSVVGPVLLLTSKLAGRYENIEVTITDSTGTEYIAPLVSLLVGSNLPELTIDESIEFSWAQTHIDIFGTAFDRNGVESVSWSIDEGVSWIDTYFAEDGTWNATISLDGYGDGLIPIDVRARNLAGSEIIVRTAILKDTSPPEVVLVAPPARSVINGETTFVFKVFDNGGKLVQAQALPLSIDGTITEEGITDDALSNNDMQIIEELELLPLIRHVAGTLERPLRDDMPYLFSDAAGNTTLIDSYSFSIDNDFDRPVVEISAPAPSTVIQADFEVSSVVYDDNGPCKVWASIDGGAFFLASDNANSFVFPVEFASLTDNEHSITVYAEDLHGVKGEEVSVTFYVSTEEPKGSVVEPAIGAAVNGLVTLNGVSSDINGIDKVFISVDNANTYSEAEGTDIWQYVFDSRLLQDGNHVVFLRVLDNYGVEGIYSSLINVDNTPPEMQLDLPLDGSSTADTLFFSGQITDNIGLEKLWVNITALDRDVAPVPDELAYIEFKPDVIISEVIDISSLDDGLYNIEIIGEDASGNQQRISKNIEMDSAWQNTVVDLMYPLSGGHVQGIFNIYGQAVSRDPVKKLILFMDDLYVAETTLADTGYFKFVVTPEMLSEGSHSMYVQATTATGAEIISNKHLLNYVPSGPWISIDNFSMGDFVIDRPLLEGSAGYAMTEQDLVDLESKETPKYEKEIIEAKSLKTVEISFDNGKTFELIGQNEKWRYLIEDDYLQEEYRFLIVRATMENGEISTTRSIISIDKTAPVIKLVSPAEGDLFNGELEFVGLASDNVTLEEVTVALRSGDKGSYGVPGFMQGLYLDLHFLGSTFYDIGFGLAFFDDNVKLQVQFGQLSQVQFAAAGGDGEYRYGGFVWGGKLLANIGSIPFERFLGPDWAWLSASVALGANFSYFADTQSENAQALSAILLQLEFPRVTIPNQDLFNTLSFYTEGQLWFIPTDIKSSPGGKPIPSIVPQIAFGIRANVF